MEDNRVSFDLDGVIGLLQTGAELLLSLFRPIVAGIMAIAGDGPIGLLVVFVIFFAIFLARTAAKTRNSHDFGVAIMHVGRFGVRWTGAYAVLLFLEIALLPLLVCLFILCFNSLTGHDPGLMRFFELAFSDTPTGQGLIADIMGIYGDGSRYLLPLGWRATLLVFAAFGCMILVGRAFVGAAQNANQYG